MKNSFLILLVICCLNASKTKAQGSFDKIFNTVYDRFGEKYRLADLNLASDNQLSRSKPLPTVTCTAGYFRLYFETGSFFTTNANAQYDHFGK